MVALTLSNLVTMCVETFISSRWRSRRAHLSQPIRRLSEGTRFAACRNVRGGDQPGTRQGARSGCEFNEFRSEPSDLTPQDLVGET